MCVYYEKGHFSTHGIDFGLQILATYHDWFYEVFDKMPRDGREMQWRLLCEGDTPEIASKFKLPDNADDHYTALQRLLVIRYVQGFLRKI